MYWLLLLVLLWKPIYLIGYEHFYKKDPTALDRAKNWGLALLDLVKP
jgi:hypothetical protein